MGVRYGKEGKGIAKNQPIFWGLAFRDAFRQALLAGLCVAILWLILSDLVRLVVGSWPCVSCLEHFDFLQS